MIRKVVQIMTDFTVGTCPSPAATRDRIRLREPTKYMRQGTTREPGQTGLRGGWATRPAAADRHNLSG